MDKTTDHTEATTGAGLKRRLPTRLGLSDKLLVLTILFVMIAEVLIYVPSIANYRLNWLRDKLSDAYTAALVLEATPEVPDASDPAGARLDRRARRRHEDGVAAPAADGRRHAAVGRSRHRSARGVLVSRHHARLRGAALERQRGHPRARQCAARRRVRRDHHGREAAARGDAAVLVEHPAAVADHLRDHRGAGLPRAALPVRAAAAPDDRQHDGVPRRSRRIPGASSSPPAGRTRSAPPNASSATCSASSARCCSRRPASRRSGLRCRRSTTTCATCSRPRNCSPTGCRARRTSRCSASRRNSCVRSSARSRSASRPCPMAARRSRRRTGVRSRSSRWCRRCASRSSSRPTRRSAGSARSSAG